MREYVDLLQKVLKDGEPRKDRTGVGTKSIFGGEISFDLRARFPLVTIKKTNYTAAFTEMLWFLRGEMNTEYLLNHGVKIWQPWADKNNMVGRIYGVQWRNWNRTLDQINTLIDGLKSNPHGRRHIVTAWNPSELGEMALPPCHYLFQCYVTNCSHIDLRLSQRSWDLMLGAPFNIAQYALLLHMIAHVTGYKARYLQISYGDAHIYENHLAAAEEMLKTRDVIYCPTELEITHRASSLDDFSVDSFKVHGYMSYPHISLPVAV